MKQKITSLIFALTFLITVPLLLTGCSGKKNPDTLSGDTLPDSLKELYDAQTLLNKADRLFKEKDYTGATQEYRRFLELHPLHSSASYAQYRIGLSYFKLIRTIDRDIEPAQKALAAFETVLKDYPDNEYADEVREKIRICREKLAEREFYIGNFYLRKEDYPAAIERFNNILTEYADTEVVQKAFYHLGIAYSSSGESTRAVEVLQNLISKYPETTYKKDATQLLAKLNGR